MHEDVDRVLGGRPVTAAGLPGLVHTGRVVDEVLRKYPVWILTRRALREADLGGVRVPEGGEVIVSPHALHHDPAATLALTNVVIPFTRKVEVPVMIVVGNDTHFCGAPLGSDCSSAEALRASEAPYFPPSARLHTYVLDGYGHSINYAPNAPDYHRAVIDWVKTLP